MPNGVRRPDAPGASAEPLFPRKNDVLAEISRAIARSGDHREVVQESAARLQRYFGTSELSEASPAVQAAGLDRLRVEFGLETDRGRRFALWSLLYLLGQAPDLDVAFKDEADREAARDLMDMLDRQED